MKLKTKQTDPYKRLDTLLEMLPADHVKFNENLVNIALQEKLVYNNVIYPMVGGVYEYPQKKIILYQKALLPSLNIAGKRVPFFDFTLFTLIGHTLFYRDDVATFWAENFYPDYDAGAGATPNFKTVDRFLIQQQITLGKDGFKIPNATVSLDRYFALCYASYIFFRDELKTNYPKAWLFMNEKIFYNPATAHSLRNAIRI